MKFCGLPLSFWQRGETDSLNGSVLLACALHKLGRTDEACETLNPACNAFPKESGPPYNLARNRCALGRIAEAQARQWLARALEIGGEELKRRALADEELAAVW